MSFDWLSAKTEYITGAYKLREISERHGISLSTLRKKSAEEEWTAQKTENLRRLHGQGLNFCIGSGSEVGVGTTFNREYRIAERISELLERATAEQMEVFATDENGEQVSKVDIPALEKALKILKQVEEVKRFIGGLTTVQEDRQFRLNAEKLELERQRLKFGTDTAAEDESCGVVILPEIDDVGK